MKKREYILCAAIWYKELELKKPDILRIRGYGPYNITDSVVFCGWRHHNCIAVKSAITGLRDHEAGENVQGFLTNLNRFVDRGEAAIIALKAGQISEPLERLHSEDLY